MSNTNIEVNPAKLHQLVSIMKQLDQEPIRLCLESLSSISDIMEGHVRGLAEASESLLTEAQRTTRLRAFDDEPSSGKDPLEGLRRIMDGSSFITVIHNVIAALAQEHKNLLGMTHLLLPEEIILFPSTGPAGAPPKTFEEIQILSYQFQIHQGAFQRFINGVFNAEEAPNRVADLCRHLGHILDRYYAMLVKRHTTEGILVHGDPISTDLALTIFENTDSNGEIRDGKDPKEVSTYSIQKALLIADALKIGVIADFLSHPDTLMELIRVSMKNLWEASLVLSALAQEPASKLRALSGGVYHEPHLATVYSFERSMSMLKNLDPRNIVYKEKTGLLSVEERRDLAFKNETLKEMVYLLRGGTQMLIDYVLERKQTQRQYELEENSFYVCKIGAGNPFSGEAPGQLTVVPGSKPSVLLDDVIGSGFDQVREFLGTVEHSARWHDLFVATSPSKKADKSNVLLVGPQGCGKTEILRAVASDRKSIGIFAQASDFLTCWKGEAEKNPKRLFEGGRRLQMESRKQVYFLIDEIDTILNGDRGQAAFGGTNLATEFQVLMDGITTYPNLALWGATNHPDRIPMPLLRRFAKVVIVGELSQQDRVKLLQQFVNYLPVHEEFEQKDWEVPALRLEGAVGDVVRKVADHLWREKMSKFVEQHPREAEEIVKVLNPNGVKFSVGDMKYDTRLVVKGMLRPYLVVTPADVLRSVETHLDNIAIQQEIQTCRDTYDNARRFLSGLNARD